MSEFEESDEFRDYGSDPVGKTEYLDAVAKHTAEYRRRVRELMEVRPGDTVLDVGCGAGISMIDVGRLAGNEGRVAGIDKNPALLAEARRRAEEAGLGRRVGYAVSFARSIPFADDSFDLCYSENLFMHLSNPERTLAEMKRVTKPGGRILVGDLDHASLSIDFPDTELERTFARCWAARHFNPYAGRKLRGSFRRQGLSDVGVQLRAVFLGDDLRKALYLFQMDDLLDESVENGALTREDAARFGDGLKRAFESGEAYITMTLVVVFGRKPSSDVAP
jgi:ubiquinone/menaquinone biosynthesis C-methylase UbiE